MRKGGVEAKQCPSLEEGGGESGEHAEYRRGNYLLRTGREQRIGTLGGGCIATGVLYCGRAGVESDGATEEEEADSSDVQQ